VPARHQVDALLSAVLTWLALAFLTEKLSERGYKVFCVPEIPTLTVHGGGMIVMGLLTQDKVIRFQVRLGALELMWLSRLF
jgi:hypothetical protein